MVDLFTQLMLLAWLPGVLLHPGQGEGEEKRRMKGMQLEGCGFLRLGAQLIVGWAKRCENWGNALMCLPSWEAGSSKEYGNSAERCRQPCQIILFSFVGRLTSDCDGIDGMGWDGMDATGQVGGRAWQ